MSDWKSSLVVGKQELAPRICIYGPHGIGKSTLAAAFPKPIFISTEDGLATLDVTSFPKGKSVGKYILAPLAENKVKIRAAIKDNYSVEALVNEMCKCYGWSPFMAGQGAAGPTYTHALCNAHDPKSWAPMGPGSQRGLNRLHGLKLGHLWEQTAFNEALMEVHQHLLKSLVGMDELSLHDVQNVLCETDKYWRVLNGEGEPRSLYKAETAF